MTLAHLIPTRTLYRKLAVIFFYAPYIKHGCSVSPDTTTSSSASLSPHLSYIHLVVLVYCIISVLLDACM
jgi:hypothetical protein